MIPIQSINQYITEYISNSEYYLVDLAISNNNKITIEIDSFNGVSLDYCIELSKFIESKFDREVEDYELEVSSAGLTEPFKVLKQYEKNIGNEIEVLTKDGKKIKGILIEVTDEFFTIETTKTVKAEGAKRKSETTERQAFSYENIKYTKYIIRFK
jgi:ribosome maturation factor RimP